MLRDDTSEKSPNLHPTEYLVPLIHQRGFKSQIPTSNTDQLLIEHPKNENGITRDPFYSNTGILLYIHYLKNYPMKAQGDLIVRSSLIYNGNPAKDQYDRNCLWITEKIPISNNLNQIPKNMFKIENIVKINTIHKNDTVLPITKPHVWLQNFYNVFWEDNLNHDLILFLEILENNNSYPSGVAVLKLNKEDGTLKVGSYELPVYKYPLHDYMHPEKGEVLGYNLVFIINEPKPEINQPQPQQPQQPQQQPQQPQQPQQNFQPDQPKSPQEERTKEENEEAKEISPEDLGKKDKNNEAFIPNTLRQYKDEQYTPDDIIAVYVDSARYLPENVTVSRVSMNAMNMTGEIVLKYSSANCLLEMSTCQKPYFGIREEIIKKDCPELDDTTILIFRIDTIERNNHQQVVCGYAFFPLFVDSEKGLPATSAHQDAVLHNGKYQIPIFSENPRLARPLRFENLVMLERIP